MTARRPITCHEIGPLGNWIRSVILPDEFVPLDAADCARRAALEWELEASLMGGRWAIGDPDRLVEVVGYLGQTVRVRVGIESGSRPSNVHDAIGG